MRKNTRPSKHKVKRLEHLRGELRAERISYGVELLEAAGVPEGESNGQQCDKT